MSQAILTRVPISDEMIAAAHHGVAALRFVANLQSDDLAPPTYRDAASLEVLAQRLPDIRAAISAANNRAILFRRSAMQLRAAVTELLLALDDMRSSSDWLPGARSRRLLTAKQRAADLISSL